jgi:hypothetical protein
MMNGIQDCRAVMGWAFPLQMQAFRLQQPSSAAEC